MAYEKDLHIRFWSKVDVKGKDNCWEWLASKCSSGYGSFCIYYATQHAHRIAWTLTNGPIPQGKLVLHKCDNRSCCNPDHLYLGTHGDNILDREYRNHSYLRGRPSRLSKDDVVEIKKSYLKGLTQTKIAKTFNISRRYVSYILNNDRGVNAT